jgi:ATP-binding cassette subfamily F protein 2
MVSASKAAREAKKAAAGETKPKKSATSKLSSKANSKNASKASSVNGDDAEDLELNEEVKKLTMQEDKHGLSDRVTTGVLASLAASRDVKITSASLVFHGKVLFNDTTLEVTYGRRYGLLGENGWKDYSPQGHRQARVPLPRPHRHLPAEPGRSQD